MPTQFKNRLVGITILVALVVIFLPSLVDGEKQSYQQEFVATPIKPALNDHTNSFDANNFQEEKIVVENENSGETLTESNQADEWKVEEVAEAVSLDDNSNTNSNSNSNNITTEPPIETAVIETKKVESKKVEAGKTTFEDPAWTIQLGAFQNKANINALLKKLNKAGFQVHTMPREVMDGQLTRVFVGPDVSKEKLEAQLPRLKRLTELNGKLVPFNPTQP